MVLTEIDGLRLTAKQQAAIEHLTDGEWHAFGSGFGHFRIALRALHHRAPQFLEYEAKDGEEYFHLSVAAQKLARMTFTAEQQISERN